MKQNIYDILVNLLKLQVTILKEIQDVNKKLDEAVKQRVFIDTNPPSVEVKAHWADMLVSDMSETGKGKKAKHGKKRNIQV